MTEYVIRDGQRIAVKTLSTSATPRRRRTSDPFATVPLAWAARAAKATNTKKALVWLELLYATWQSRNNSVVLSNGRWPGPASPETLSTGPCASSKPLAWSRWSGVAAEHPA